MIRLTPARVTEPTVDAAGGRFRNAMNAARGR